MIWGVLSTLRVFFAANSLLASAIAGIVAFVGYSAYQRHIGATNATAKIEARDARSVSKARKAASASGDPTARGVRDPYTRD